MFILRRLIFVTSALFMTSDTLVLMAVAQYIVLSLLDLLYVAMAKPFMEHKQNYTEMINEVFVLFIAFFAYLLMDNSMSR